MPQKSKPRRLASSFIMEVCLAVFSCQMYNFFVTAPKGVYNRLCLEWIFCYFSRGVKVI